MHPNDPDAPSLLPAPETGHHPAGRRTGWLGALLALLVLVLLGGAAWYLVQRASSDGSNASRSGGAAQGPGGPGGGRATVTVGAAVAKVADIPVLIDALGTVTPVTTAALRPQVSGVLAEVLFTEGQWVKKGQLVARIDPRPFEQALMQAQGTRQRDEAQLENARLTLKRYRTLLSQDSIARQDVDTQAALVKQLEGTVTTDLALERGARLNLDYTRITAPVAGRIGLRSVDAGNYVAPGDANGIATVTQTMPIDVLFTVPQDQVQDIQASAGAASLVATAWDRARTHALATGRFATLDNQVDTATGTVKAKARFANADGALFPSQFVNVQLLLRTLSAVVVPVTAVRTGPQGDFVYVINEDRTVALRLVKRGQAAGSNMAINDGLKAGERVVTEGGDRLKDGATVQLPGQGGAGTGAHGAHSPGAAGAPGSAAAAGGQRRQRPAQNP